MSFSQSSEELITELVRQAAPVRPIPPLRRALGQSALVWAATGATFGVLGPWWPDALGTLSERPEALAVCAGLAALGAGGTLYGMAAAVPGREGTARLGGVVASAGGAGIAVAALGGSFAPASQSYQLSPLPWDAACFGFAVLGSLPVALASLRLCREAAVLRPRAAALALALGSSALGAVLLQALCSEGSARHTLGSHVAGPVLVVPVLALALLSTLRRRDGFPAQARSALDAQR